jgi:hypothetical protein
MVSEEGRTVDRGCGDAGSLHGFEPFPRWESLHTNDESDARHSTDISMTDTDPRKVPVGRGWIIAFVAVEALILGYIVYHMIALR